MSRVVKDLPAIDVALTPMQRLRIRARSGVANETLANYLADPTSVRDASRMRIEAAAKDEGIELPSWCNRT